MTAPNMVNITSMVGKYTNQDLAPGNAQTMISNPANSNKVYKVNTVIVTNIDGTNAADFNMFIETSGTSKYLARSITVPADSNLVVISKDTALYLEEDMVLSAAAYTSGDLVCHCSWEEIE